MSFDAENRNNINNYPINNSRLNNGVSIIQNRIIQCSFCNCYGHNITMCNDSRITDFEEECQISKSFCEMTENSREIFKEWLMAYSIEVDVFVVRAFAISKCNCRANLAIDILIDRIVSYMYQEHIPFPTILSEDILTQDAISFYMELEIIMSLISLQNEDYSTLMNSNSNINQFNITAIVEEIELKQGDEFCECAICYEDNLQKKNFVTLNCKHQFCKDCFKSSVKNTPQNKELPSCALCRADISSITVHDESVKGDIAEFCKNE